MTSHGDGDQEIYGDYSVDDEDQPGNIDDLGDEDVVDELDRGYSPPEHWSAGQGYGNTPYGDKIYAIATRLPRPAALFSKLWPGPGFSRRAGLLPGRACWRPGLSGARSCRPGR